MAEEIDFENRHFWNFKFHVTLTRTSDDLKSHSVINVSSTLTNTTIWSVAPLSFIVDVRTYGRTYGRTDIWTDIFTGFIRSSLRRWPKKPNKHFICIIQNIYSSTWEDWKTGRRSEGLADNMCWSKHIQEAGCKAKNNDKETRSNHQSHDEHSISRHTLKQHYKQQHH